MFANGEYTMSIAEVNVETGDVVQVGNSLSEPDSTEATIWGEGMGQGLAG